jgi:hypothetical protein
MATGFGTGGLMDIILLVISILGLILCVMWIFLPWILVSKMDRMIELLEGIAGKK